MFDVLYRSCYTTLKYHNTQRSRNARRKHRTHTLKMPIISSLFSSKKKAEKYRRRSNLGSIPESSSNHDSIHKGKSHSAYIDGYASSMVEVATPVKSLAPDVGQDGGLELFEEERNPLSLDDFILVKVLGKGSFGKVTLCQHKETRKYYALKVLSKPSILKQKQVEHTKTERNVLTQVQHPYVSQLFGAFQTQDKLYFVLEFCSGGELFFHLQRQRRFTEEQAVHWTAEIILALEHLHKMGVAYRDLKPENLLLDGDGHIRLCDFGLAKSGLEAPNEGAFSMCGTPEYLAPEMLKREGHGTAVDWWGLGMVLFELLTGLPPWYTTDTAKLFERVKYAPLMFPRSVSPEAKEIITGLLNKDPSERFGSTPESIEFMKNHKLFEHIDWDALARKQVPSPYVPYCSDGVAVGNNFEAQFTKMPINSVCSDSELTDSFCAARDAAENMFTGFTYENETIFSLRKFTGSSYENETIVPSGSPAFQTCRAA
jgi:serine/threonine protein kinase